MRKMMKGIVAVLAVSAVMAGSAVAADKLKVMDSTGNTTMFSVEDNGNFSVPGSLKYDNASKFLGIGTATPQAVFHANYKTAFAPFLLERELDNNGAVSLTADNFGGNGAGSLTGSGMLFRFAKGTKAAPANVAPGDRLGFLVFGGSAGGAMRHTVAIDAMVDAGTVSSTSLPTYVQIATTPNGSTARAERLRIGSDGRIRLSNQPAAPVATDACTTGDLILDAPNGYLYLCTASGAWKRATFAAY